MFRVIGGSLSKRHSPRSLVQRHRRLLVHTALPSAFVCIGVSSTSISSFYGPTKSQCESAVMVPSSSPKLDIEWDTPAVSAWKRYWNMFCRLVKLTFTLAPVVLLSPLLTYSKGETADAHSYVLSAENDEMPWILEQYLNLCLKCVENAGAAVIKLMQWAGSRPDLFGHEFCQVFSRLQDHTTPHSFKHTEKQLIEAFGENWRERVQIGDVLGSGCIGQVYKGKVQKNGEWQDVAIKVLHPSVRRDIEADLDLMRGFVAFLNALPFKVFTDMKWLNLGGVVEEFAGLLRGQLDLRTEGANLDRFQKNFKDDPHIVFPERVEGFDATPEVLVETFCEGVPILKFAREHRQDHKLLSELCTKAIRTVCKMIFIDNCIHGDLHPGNVFVSKDGKDFILLDVGIVNEYTDRDHEIIVDILGAFIRREGRKAGALMISDSNDRLSTSKSGDKALDEEKFIDKIESISLKATSGDEYLMEHLGSYISFICDAAAYHHIMLNKSWVSAVSEPFVW